MFTGGGKKGKKNWWLVPGSNQRPVDYDSNALPTELTRHQININIHPFFENASRKLKIFTNF